MADKPETRFVPQNPMVSWILEEDSASLGQVRSALNSPENSDLIHWRDPENQWTLLHYACFAKNKPAVDLLLKHGAVVNVFSAEGKSPFSLAAVRDDERGMTTKRARDLRKRGGAIQRALQGSGALYTQDQMLIKHAYKMAADMPRRKVRDFPSVKMAEHALRYAASQGHERALSNLLECGVKANATGPERVTALQHVVGGAYRESKKRRMFKALVKHGGSASARDANNYSVYDHALTSDTEPSGKFLRWVNKQVSAQPAQAATAPPSRFSRPVDDDADTSFSPAMMP